jgi:hypothetical protein
VDDLQLSELIRNWGIAVGGAIGIGLAFWRSLAADRQSLASRSQAETARRAHITEVFKDAVGQLSHERLEIRLGAIFTLSQISVDFPDFRHYVTQVLTAYVRERTAGANPDLEPPPDIREIMVFLQERLSEE